MRDGQSNPARPHGVRNSRQIQEDARRQSKVWTCLRLGQTCSRSPSKLASVLCLTIQADCLGLAQAVLPWQWTPARRLFIGHGHLRRHHPGLRLAQPGFDVSSTMRGLDRTCRLAEVCLLTAQTELAGASKRHRQHGRMHLRCPRSNLPTLSSVTRARTKEPVGEHIEFKRQGTAM